MKAFAIICSYDLLAFASGLEILTTKYHRRPSEPLSSNVQVPGTSSTKAPTSLGSKFAAHFTHPRPSKAAKGHSETAPAAGSSGLAPPSARSGSFESGSSSGSKSRSTTPRPPQPTIMVSLSSDNSEFKDLFTRPTNLPSSSSKVPSPSNTKSQPLEPSIYKRGYTPASAIAAAVRDQHSSETPRSSSTSSKTSTSMSSKHSGSRKNSDSDKSHDRPERASTPRLSEARESPRPIPLEEEKGLPPSLQRRSSVVTGPGQASESSSSSTRSRMKQPSVRQQGRPPSMPLPLHPSSTHSTPPPSSPPSSPLPDPPANTSLPSQPSEADADALQKIHIRPRAHTISSINNAPMPLSPSPLSRSGMTSPPTSASTIVPHTAEGGTLDIDNASVDELRQALKARNNEYEALTASMLKMTEAHVAEVASLEKKVALLEKEARKRETQIKGFTWLLNDGEAPQQSKLVTPGPAGSSRLASRAIAARESLSDHDGYRTPPSSSRRFAYQSDSGAESHATSGPESFRASGASGSESVPSIFRKSKLRRPYPIGESSQGLSRTGSMLRSSKGPPAANSEKPLPDAPYNVKRSSMSSMSASPSSSTSSLLLPSPSVTMSSLSAIPEASDQGGALRFPQHESSDLSDERRAIRQLRRISTSSLTSSSTAASSSYSTNVKRSRPPSIAQVLEKSPNLGDVPEKLHHFS